MRKSQLNRLLKQINKLKEQNLMKSIEDASKALVANDVSNVLIALDVAAVREDTLNRLRATIDAYQNQKARAKMKRARVGFKAAGEI